MFKFTEALGLEQGVISAWGKPLITEACCHGGKGQGRPHWQGTDCQLAYGKGFHCRNGETSYCLMKAARIECIVSYMEYLIIEESYVFQLTEQSNQYCLPQTVIYLSYNSLNLKYY